MKVVNIMNFVRRIDERHENSTEKLLDMTAAQLRLVNKYGLDNTFLLQYDTVCDNDFVSLFKNEATDKTELGLWYEIVEPMTSACGIPYESEKGWKWDWHIIPGYSMAYTPAQRELLIDETMRKFKEVFGYYPKTVAGWVIDTHTLNYLEKNYDISAVAFCRDQANTDAYTLLGGYFNGGYYPSKNNIFTPASSRDMQTDIPAFRLLGPCPIHNYDNNKYSSDEFKAVGKKSACFTLEPCWYMGSTPDITEWMFNCFYGTESLGFAYSQIGQENSFYMLKDQLIEGTKTQIEQLIARGDVVFQKMCDTGEYFKNRYKETPATAVVAPDNFDLTDVQSTYYDCKNYTANLFRFEDKLFIRSLFLFDQTIEDHYLKNNCETFDAVFENLPIVDSMTAPDEDKKCCGMMIDENALPFDSKKGGDGVLCAGPVTFYEDKIEILSPTLTLFANSVKGELTVAKDSLEYCYKGHKYSMLFKGATACEKNGNIVFKSTDGKITLIPKREGSKCQ